LLLSPIKDLTNHMVITVSQMSLYL